MSNKKGERKFQTLVYQVLRYQPLIKQTWCAKLKQIVVKLNYCKLSYERCLFRFSVVWLYVYFHISVLLIFRARAAGAPWSTDNLNFLGVQF